MYMIDVLQSILLVSGVLMFSGSVWYFSKWEEKNKSIIRK